MSRRDANKCEFSYERTVKMTRRETAFSSAEEDTASAKFRSFQLNSFPLKRPPQWGLLLNLTLVDSAHNQLAARTLKGDF